MDSNKQKITILLLSAPIGSGHRLAAEALREQFAKYENIDVIHGNIFDFFPSIIGTTFLRFYLWILSCCPWMYELAYKWGNRENGSIWLRSILNKALLALGSNFLRRVKPDAVIATHATPAGIMTYYKQKHPEVFLGAVVTDFTIHKWWLCDGVDAYFIADERLREKITVPSEIIPYGIPVREQFLQNNRAQCRAGFAWKDEEHICLLMGGGEGLLPMEQLLQALINTEIKGLRLIAITGHNSKMEQTLREKFSYYDQLEIYGYREDVPQLMAGADMIITKAGGLTSAEVLASNLELIIYKPLPGQEQGNAAFLRDNYCVRIANDVPGLIRSVESLCAHAKGIQSVKSYGKPLAAKQICEYTLEHIHVKKFTT